MEYLRVGCRLALPPSLDPHWTTAGSMSAVRRAWLEKK
jgi:hypothetical protein